MTSRHLFSLRDARSYLRLAALIIIALVIVVLVRWFLVEPFVVSGTSMEPTYGPNDYLVIDRISYRFDEPARGDAVVFRYPLDPSTYFVKRIVGLPGDTVSSNGNSAVVYAGGDLSKPPVFVLFTPEEPGETLVPTTTLALASDEYFVVGDNAVESSDSREWGPLQKKFIVGRVLMRLWPPF